MEDEGFDLEGLHQPNIDDIPDIEINLVGNIHDRFEVIEEAGDHQHHHNNNNELHQQHIPLNRLVQETDEPNDEMFWQEFLSKVRGNLYTGDYFYMQRRVERLIRLMLFDATKTEQFAQVAVRNTSLKCFSLDVSMIEEEEEEETSVYYQRWAKIGDAMRKFSGLKEIQINAGGYLHHHNAPDFAALATVLRGVNQIERLIIKIDLFQEDDIMSFAKHLPFLTKLKEIHFHGYMEPQPLRTIAQELQRVSSLEIVELHNCYNPHIPCRELPDNVLVLLNMPSLKRFGLQRCHLSRHQCDMLAKVLRASNVTSLDFQYSRFEGNGGAILMKSLGTNNQVEELSFSTASLNKATCEALSEALRVNSSVNSLSFVTEEEEWSPDLQGFDTNGYSPIFQSLVVNAHINFLKIGDFDQWTDYLVDEFRVVLESPTGAIEKLWLMARGDALTAWQRVAPFLRTNQTLNSLRLLAAVGHDGVLATASQLAHNTTLETLEVFPCFRMEYKHAQDDTHQSKHCDYDCISAQAVKALGKNDTLQKLDIDMCHTHSCNDKTEEATRQLIQAMRGNFGLTGSELSWDRDRTLRRPMEAITSLNGAGRRYIRDDPSNRFLCVKVLGQVSDDLDALFLHLQENPSVFAV